NVDCGASRGDWYFSSLLSDDGKKHPANITDEEGFTRDVPEDQRSNYFSIIISTTPGKDMQ
ncbi:hypothetical protein, partial [Stenotrophomonas sp. NPDC077659]|uniref:hypothetical protein n=1 Tax=Stenotrophomonas sp. NPDC077659 TaxID=3390694 RepID=UPI003CFE8543